MAVAEVFRALGEPTRLEMVRRLSGGTLHTISSISSGLAISRQGARKHLQVLADAHLVSLQPVGREINVRLEPEALQAGRAFIAEMEQRWDERLEALRRLVDDPPK
jgi:DNA-binding transcriptional ArsR family regulator